MKQCYLCGANGRADGLDRHHIFGGANRKLSEKMGLVVYLCHDKCHLFGAGAVHQNADVRARLHEEGQRRAMEAMKWSVEEFRAVFGKNYLLETEANESGLDVFCDEDDGGFVVLDERMPAWAL